EEVGGGGGEVVPVVVPADLALLLGVALEPLLEDLPLRVLRRADRVVERDEVHRTEPAPLELGGVAAGAGDLHRNAGRRLLPRLDPERVCELGRLVVMNELARVAARREAGIGR